MILWIIRKFSGWKTLETFGNTITKNKKCLTVYKKMKNSIPIIEILLTIQSEKRCVLEN